MTSVLLIALSLSASGPPAKIKPVVDALGQMESGALDCRKNLVVRFHDGTPQLGETTIRIAKGWIRVVRAEPGVDAVVHRGRLPEEMCQRFARNAVKKLWRVHKQKREPLHDETLMHLKVGVKDVGSIRAVSWDNDIQNKRVFAVARAQLLILARRVSKGAVTY